MDFTLIDFYPQRVLSLMDLTNLICLSTFLLSVSNERSAMITYGELWLVAPMVRHERS